MLDAYKNAYDGEYIDGLWVVNEHVMIAAAIRALVEQTLPEEPWPVSMMGPVYVAEAKQRRKLRAELLTIAAELAGTTATTETP